MTPSASAVSRRLARFAFAAPITCTAGAPALAQSDLIALPYQQMIAYGLSGDGAVVVGQTQGPGGSVTWTQAGGVQLLSPSSGDGVATDASYDSSVIVGIQFSVGVYRWTPATGMQFLGVAPGYTSSGTPLVSTDGSIVVGTAVNPGTQQDAIWRWTEATGLQLFGNFTSAEHTVAGLSGDGSVVIGNDLVPQFRPGVSYSYPGKAWSHTVTGSVALPSPAQYFAATGLSDDGQTIVGGRWSYNGLGHASNHVAVRWVDGGPQQDIGLLAGHPYSRATVVSADGSVIAGDTGGPYFTLGEAVWIWTQPKGIRDLKQVLLDLGVASASNWTLRTVVAMSDDGAVILGYGDDAGLGLRPWLAILENPCYADCSGDGNLTVADFTCFQTRFIAGDPYADCDTSGTLTVADFTCFQTAFVAGCP